MNGRSFLLGLAAGFLLGMAATSCGQNPAAELRVAIADLEANVPRSQWPAIRYLSAWNLDADRLRDYHRVASFVLNSVSRTANIVSEPTRVPGRAVLRVDLARLGIPHDVWEKLVADECYWHIRTKVADPKTGKVQEVITDGGWVGLDDAARLRTMSASTGAVVRLDWFVAKVCQPPHYYSFAAVPATSTEWYKSLGMDKDKIVQLRANHGANMFESGITKHPRRLSRYQGPLGAGWQTYDSDGTDPAKDPIRNPSFDSGYEASELIATKANGLHIFGLYDAAGKRQDAVPDRIAKDDSDPHGNGIVIPMISCVRCHAVDGGLRSFANDTKKLMESGVDILTDSPFSAEGLASFYLSDKLERDIRRDREDYAAAVSKATGGWTPKQTAAALAELFAGYEYRQVTPEMACAELGVRSLEGLRSSRDGVLLALMAGQKVQRKQFEASFAEAAVLCGGR